MSDDLLRQLESPARWWWSGHPKGERKIVSTAPQQAAARIREQCDLLNECENAFDFIAQGDCTCTECNLARAMSKKLCAELEKNR